MTEQEIKSGALGSLPSLDDLDKDLTQEEQEAQDKLEADIKAKADAEAADAKQKAEEEAARAKEEADKQKTPEQLEAERKAEEDKQKAEARASDDEDAITDAKAYWDEVNKRHGFNDFKVEYGEVDPGTPEGAYLREKALIQRSQLELEGHIKETLPRAYSYMLHIQAGGNDEDFFATPSITLPEYEQFKNSVDLQKQVYTKDLRSKGMDEEYIPGVIEKAQKDNKLFDKADAAYKGIETAEKKAVEAAEQSAAERTKQEQTQVKTMVDAITDIVQNNKTDQFAIPDTKKAAFNEYLKEHLMYDGEKFFFIKPVKQEGLNKLVEQEFFAFVNGNLNELVKRRSDTARAQQFRVGLKKTEKAASSKESNNDSGGFVPLSEI